MSSGPLFPSSIFVSRGASNQMNVWPSTFTPSTNTNSAGSISCLKTFNVNGDVTATHQFNLPGVIPAGSLKARLLSFSSYNGASENATIQLSDGQTPVGSNIGATTLTTESLLTITYSSSTTDQIVETKQALTTTPTASNILTVSMKFVHSGWTLVTVFSAYQLSLVWE